MSVINPAIPPLQPHLHTLLRAGAHRPPFFSLTCATRVRIIKHHQHPHTEQAGPSWGFPVWMGLPLSSRMTGLKQFSCHRWPLGQEGLSFACRQSPILKPKDLIQSTLPLGAPSSHNGSPHFLLTHSRAPPTLRPPRTGRAVSWEKSKWEGAAFIQRLGC